MTAGLCDFCGKPLGYYSHVDCTPEGEAAREMEDESTPHELYVPDPMNTAQLTPREVVEDYAEQSIVQAASFTSEGARIVCHVQLGSVPTVYRVVAEFYTAAFSIDTACANMIGDLSRMAAQDDLYHAQGGDAVAAIDQAKAALTAARAAARQLGEVLQAAQNVIASVGHTE